MDLLIGLFLDILGILFFLAAIYEELYNVSDDEETDKTVMIFLVLTIIFFIVGGVSMFYVTETYYTASQGLTEVLITSYQPIGWLSIGLGMFVLLLTMQKGFDLFSRLIHSE